MDGVIGANELNLTMMDVMKVLHSIFERKIVYLMLFTKYLTCSHFQRGFAHSACSGMSYGRMAGCLLEKGYKVARAEQTETQEMANQRIAGGTLHTSKLITLVNLITMIKMFF